MAELPTAESSLSSPGASSRFAYFAILGSPRRTILFGIVLLALLGYADVSAGPSLKLTCFYLIPAFLLTWFMGRSWGYAVAVVYGVVIFAAEAHAATHPVYVLLLWNAVVRIATIVGFTLMVYVCKNMTREIERLVDAKTAGLQREITLRKESEEAIHQLASQLSAAEDAQRKQLGHDLHDTLSQNLTVLKLQLEEITGEVPADSKVQYRISSSLSLLEALIQQTRTLTFELYPSMLDDLGIVATLRRFAEQFESQTTVRILVTESDTPQALPSPISAFLFRAAKELITNAAKHGKAREILVQIRWRKDGVRVVIDDDGTGFDPDQALHPENRKGIGLAAITERLRYFGGMLRIESSDQQGSRALIDFPLPESTRAAAE